MGATSLVNVTLLGASAANTGAANARTAPIDNRRCISFLPCADTRTQYVPIILGRKQLFFNQLGTISCLRTNGTPFLRNRPLPGACSLRNGRAVGAGRRLRSGSGRA